MRSVQLSEVGMDFAPNYTFRLYVAGDGPNSVQAVANLDAMCRRHLSGRSVVEVIDVCQEPMRALDDGVFMTPTLLKVAPDPERRVVGTLSQMASVLAALDIEEVVS